MFNHLPDSFFTAENLEAFFRSKVSREGKREFFLSQIGREPFDLFAVYIDNYMCFCGLDLDSEIDELKEKYPLGTGRPLKCLADIFNGKGESQ